MRRRRSFRTAIAAVGVGLVVAACVPLSVPPLAPPPPDIGAPAGSPNLAVNATFITASNGTALANPWDVAFTPDGTTGVFTERSGRISSFDPASGATVLRGTIADTRAVGESGLMGIAIDPAFATNHFIYVCISSQTSNSNEVRRYALDLAGPVNGSLSGGIVMLSGMPVNNFHDGCRIRFDPVLTSPPALFVTMGDAGIGPGPQSLSSLAGKILRTRTDWPSNQLEPYDGNPFAASPKPTSLIYSFGHRNPQGLAFRPGSNQPYNTEHGPSINDEVNALVPGANAGWDPNTNGSYDQSKPMTDLAKFPYATRPAWRSGDSFTLAPSGATFVVTTPSADWGSWSGALVVAFLKDAKLRVMFLDGNGNVCCSQPVVGGKRLRSVTQGPDGALYVTTDAGSPNDAIYKITPV